MLIPLVDRAVEMAELLENPKNSEWVTQARNTLGPEVYDNCCVPLWTGKPRWEVSDYEWLKSSESLLVKRGAGQTCDSRLWIEFCRMVGWDAGALDFSREDVNSQGVRHKESKESLTSTSSGKMGSIAEVEEYDEHNYRLSGSPRGKSLS